MSGYKTNDTEGVLPESLQKKAIAFARKTSGMDRPHKSQVVLIDAFRECFKAMQELDMVKKEYACRRK